jgi:DNA polymerase-3 subunit alpha
MTDRLVHLHTHSEYSFLDGLSTIDQVINRVVELGQESVAITDHGECGGHLRLQRAADKAGIKPLFGMEGYFTEDRFEKSGRKGETYDHMTIVALNNKGLENLWALSSLAYIEGSYYGNPRFDWELLERYNEGLIVTGGCMGGCIGKHLKDGEHYEKAVERIGRYQAIFGDRFHLELHTYLDPESNEWNLRVAEAAVDFSVPLLAVSDSHYAEPEQWFAHELMTAIQMGKTINDPNRFSYGPNQLCIFSEEETRSRLSYLPESLVDQAINRTNEIAQMCDARVPGSRKMPVFYSSSAMDERKIREVIEEGFANKIVGHVDEELIPKYRERMEYELEVIVTRGFPGYFLTVHDIIDWSKKNGFLVGPSRGSVGGSLLAYVMGITTVDPMPSGLIFERFLNPERVSMPDIDIDMPKNERHLVREYLENKYGRNNIASIGTLNTLGPKQALRDICRGLDINKDDTQKMIDIIDDDWNIKNRGATWEDVEKQYAKEYSPWRTKYSKLFDNLPEFVNHIRHTSAHAAGILISKETLLGAMPLRYSPQNDDIRTQFDMNEVDELGFVKIDLLGLRTLSTLMAALELIKTNNDGVLPFKHFYDWNHEWEKYYDDPAVWDSVGTGNNIGLFQIETGSLRSLVKRFLPRSIEDLCTMIAIYRPGITRSFDAETGLNLLEMYMQKREGKRKVTYKHPKLEKILGVSYGSFVYQEQIMETCVELAGYTIVETDRVRKAVAKSNYEDMKEEAETFVQKCIESGIDKRTAESIFDDMRAFGMYGFNKSHGYGYSMLSYWTAWMKYYYPREYMTALFRTNPSDSVIYTREARRLGIQVLGPDINESEGNFTLTSAGVIRYGLSSVKYVANAAEELQKLGPYKSMEDFLARVPTRKVNKRAVISMIKCGVFDSLCGSTKQALYEYLKTRKEFKKLDDNCNEACIHCAGRLSTFECYAENEENINARGHHEQELLGTMVSIDPLADYIDLIEEEQNFPGEKRMFQGEKAMIGGMVTQVKLLITKKGKSPGAEMCQVWIELPINNFDEDGLLEEEDEESSPKDESIQIVAFPSTYARIKESLEIGTPVLVEVEKLKDGLSLKNLFRLDLLKSA